MTYDELVERLGVNLLGMARCPAHDDGNPSLSVDRGEDGRTLLNCFAGCATVDVLAAVDLTLNDLFEQPRDERSSREPVDVYRYTDEAGALLFNVKRWEPGFNGERKSFSQHPADGRRGKGSMTGVRRVLYRLPEVVEAVAAGWPVYVGEGEKDCDRIRAEGETATTNAGGAGNWHTVPDAPEVLRGAKVIVVLDRDPAGLAHGRDVAASLQGKAASVTVVEAVEGPDIKDISDHLAAGHTLEQLLIVAGTVAGDPPLGEWLATSAAAEEGRPSPTGEADDDDRGHDDDVPSSWTTAVDLAAVMADGYEQPTPTVLARSDLDTDGMLFYAGAINGIHGDSGVGKGWIALSAIKAELVAGHDVILLDLEDTVSSILGRLALLRVSEEAIKEHLIYLRPTDASTEADVTALVTMIATRGVTLVVVDSLGEAFSLDGVNEDRDNEVGPWLRSRIRPLADAGAALLLVDHATKAADNPLHPSGSKRKRAAIGGASYLVTADVPLVKDDGGVLRLTCAKDRHGNYRRGQAVSRLIMNIFDGVTAVRFDVPPESRPDATPPIELAARAAVRACREAGRPLSYRTLVELMDTIKAKTDTKRAGIDEAVARGALHVEDGPHGARLHTYVHEFDDPTEGLADDLGESP